MIFGESFRGSQRQASRASRGRLNGLSRSTLRITRRGPKETNFRIVDIPGLVQGSFKLLVYVTHTLIKLDNGTNNDHQISKLLVNSYLSNALSIIV